MPDKPGKLNVEHKAIEPRLLLIRAEFFGRCIGNRLHPRRAQEPSERTAKALVIFDDARVDIA